MSLANQKETTEYQEAIQATEDLKSPAGSFAKTSDYKGWYQVARATRRVFGRNNYNLTLESDVDPERQLELSRERRANLVPAELVYMFQDMVLSVDDFHSHVEVAIQTHGYDTWYGDESNLLVTMAMIVDVNFSFTRLYSFTKSSLSNAFSISSKN
ncbi:hypothetical protein Tco_0841756 [Tanacetum coccineum]|uniref:Uncharacterized protein n=1 Tax=Tanacetum coccineum TaxID=301880 RepID=A0ABQ5AZ51_9ASTR